MKRIWVINVCAAAALLGLWLARPAAITAVDVEQARLSAAAPVPGETAALSQTFVANHNGLSAVEVRAVVYGEGEAATGTLTLELWGPGDVLVARAARAAIRHNDLIRLEVQPVPGSAGQAFRLDVSGAAPYNTTVWAYALDGYQAGRLHHGADEVAGDLQFRTEYTYLFPDMLRDAAAASGKLAYLAIPFWLVLFAPGLALLSAIRLEWVPPDRWVRWGCGLALSLAVLPLAWLWITTVGLALDRSTLGGAYAVLGALVIGRWVLSVAQASVRAWLRVPSRPFPSSAVAGTVTGRSTFKPPGSHDLSVALVLAASVLLRLLAVRDLALPAWVDSSHHAYVAQLLAESGRIPGTLGPLLADDPFTYHFGVHTVFVALAWFSRLPISQTMLMAGQVLNGLMPLAIYAGVVLITRRRLAGLVAAAHVGVVSFFPAYYATWGRYSQLAGLVLLAPAIGFVWALLARAASPVPLQRTAPVLPWGLAGMVGVLAAGLLVTHYRVFFFFVVFVLAAGLVYLRGGQGAWLRVGAGAALGGLLALPWIGRMLGAVLPLAAEPVRLASPQTYNAFPVAYFSGTLERLTLGLAAAVVLWGLASRHRVIWAATVWTLGAFGLLNVGSGTWLVNNNAWAISLFVPLALVLGYGLAWWLRRAHHLALHTRAGRESGSAWRRALRYSAGTLLLALASGVGGYMVTQGARFQVAAINPVTVLATGADVAALDWVNANTPAEAIFVINGWQWLGGSWTGSDGGAWIVPYSGRRATLPPVTYGFGSLPMQRRVGELAARVGQLTSADAPETLSLFRQQGVTHVFIGARGGNLRPEMFVGSSHYRLLFTNGAAWVFEFVEAAP